MQNIRTLYDQPIVCEDSNPPLTIRVVTPVKNEYIGGSTTASSKGSVYVLFDVLPVELKERVETAIRAMQVGG